MPRYFFDIREGGDLYPDEEGMQLPHQKAAEMEAAHTLAGLARDAVSSSDRIDVAIEVRSDTGQLFKVALIFANETKQ